MSALWWWHVTVLNLWVCLAAASAHPPRRIEMDGETVPQLPTAQRVIIAGRGSFMILHAIALFPSAAERVIAVSGGRRLNRAHLERCTRSGHLSPNLQIISGEVGPEQLLPLQPDLVVLKREATRLQDALARVGIPTMTVDLETPDTFERDIRNLGARLGDTGRADALADFYCRTRESVAGRLVDVEHEQRPRTLLIQSVFQGGAHSYRVPGADWMQTVMVELAGGRPVWTSAATRNQWSMIGLEQIAAWNPDVVFVVDFEDPNGAVATLRDHPAWRHLRAVRNQRVYAVPSDGVSWDQPDPRWILGLTWMAHRLHPARFTDRDPQAELTAFYAWYGVSSVAVQTEIAPHIQGDWP